MTSPFSEHRLPPGRHGFSPEFVAENQRWRLIGAAAEIFSERGYAGTTSHRIATRAAVSSSTFYQHFENVSELLVACFEVAAVSLLEALFKACGEPAAVVDPRAAIEAGLDVAVAEPILAPLFGLAAAAGDALIAARRRALLERLTELAGACSGPMRTPQPTSQLAVVAALAVASERLTRNEPGGPGGVARELAQLIDVAR
jgi:AcrR family transcriptional regulator